MARQMRKWWMSWKVLALAAAGGLAYFIFRGLGLSQGSAEAGAGVDHQAGAPAVSGRSALEKSEEWNLFRKKLVEFLEFGRREFLRFEESAIDEKKQSELLPLLEKLSFLNVISESEKIILTNYIESKAALFVPTRLMIPSVSWQYENSQYLTSLFEGDVTEISKNYKNVIAGIESSVEKDCQNDRLKRRLQDAIDDLIRTQANLAIEKIEYCAVTNIDNCANFWNKEIKRLSHIVEVDPQEHQRLADMFLDEETGRLYLQFRQLYQEQSRGVLAEMQPIRPEVVDLMYSE